MSPSEHVALREAAARAMYLSEHPATGAWSGEYPVGLHEHVPMGRYLQIDAMGSGRLEWLNVSPLFYRYNLGQPRETTDATDLGTALHMAVLEPDLFAERYTCEPDPRALAPHNVSPRATKAYKQAVAALENDGKVVLKATAMQAVAGMMASVLNHRHAAALLRRAPQRELTMLWEREGRVCRGRGDALGLEDELLVDLKTTRSLRRFSPWVFTDMGYHRQMGWYSDGLRRLGHAVSRHYIIAVENDPPFDCGTFVVDQPQVDFGNMQCAALLERLNECEAKDAWPGMFPNVMPAELSQAELAQFEGAEVDSDG